MRENSLMLRYIPDPTERFLDGDFQPAPGKQGLKVMPGPLFLCVMAFLGVSQGSASDKNDGKLVYMFITHY